MSYFGGKSGNGTIQTLVNLVPKHSIYFEGFAGSAALYRALPPADIAILCELCSSQLASLKNATHPGHIAVPFDVVLHIDFLSNLLTFCDTSVHRVFAYFDPPYLFSTRKSKRKVYHHELSDADHIAFLTGIRSATFDCMISHYRCDLYDSMLTGWNSLDFQSITRRGMVTETIFYNYPSPAKLQTYSMIGANFREREKFRRIEKNFLSKLNAMPNQLRNSIIEQIKNM